MIWADCAGAGHITAIRGTLYRLVESQHAIATLAYVDTLEEQAVLEALLETSKPLPIADSTRYHYLLSTPFRYPPLPWGSRFGGRNEPGLLYGGLSESTTLAEVAYYRFVFLHSMLGAPPKPTLHSQHTLFTASYRTALGVRLQNPPFSQQAARISHPTDYAASQALGSDMRDAGVQAFEYPSARDPAHGLCVGLFTPQALAGTQPRTMRQWLCELSPSEVTFKPANGASVTTFPLAVFLVDGRLAQPAA